MNSSGRVLIIFLVITAILLISLTAISLFFFQKETERRKMAEALAEEYRVEKTKRENDLKEVKKQNFLLQEKNKEADERVDDLSDELELEKGLREEMKIEMGSLKKQLEETSKAKETLAREIKTKEERQEKMAGDLSASQQKIKELEDRLRTEVQRGQDLGERYEQQRREESLRPEKSRPPRETVAGETGAVAAPSEERDISGGDTGGRVSNAEVELGEIVVVPMDAARRGSSAGAPAGMPLEKTVTILDKVFEGRVLSVDIETEFVIVSLGEKDGLAVGNVLSVYRGEEYVGDIEITRLQPEMSAADLIPPFSIRNVQKNDRVKAK